MAESTILISANWLWIYINVSGLGPVKVNITCTDQGIFIRGGVQTRRQESSLDSVFFCLFVLCSSQPIHRGVPMVLFQRGSIIWGFLWYTNVSGLGPVYIKVTCITKTVAESTILISTNWIWIHINVSGFGPVKVSITCADQGILIRGGGIQTRRQENSFDSVFFCVVLNLLTEGFQWFYFRECLSFSRGSNFFQEWGGGGGSKCQFL